MVKNSRPLVTVITPTYNRAAYLAATIDSVLDQGYPNTEYIVLDDGSTDNTCEVLERYSGRLHWETHPNMGEARTVNKGWAMARGEFVVVVNSDDPILPGLLETAVKIMHDNPELLVVYPDWLVIDEHSKPLKEVEAWDYDYKKMVLWAACIPGPGALIRRKAFDYEPARNPKYRYVADLEYWLRLGLHGPFMRIPQVLATHRHHAHSAGVAEVKSLASELVDMMNEFFNRPDLPPILRPLRNQALSAANFDACIRCLNFPELSRRFFLQAVRLDPGSLARHNRFAAALYLLVPESLKRPLRALKRRTKGQRTAK